MNSVTLKAPTPSPLPSSSLSASPRLSFYAPCSCSRRVPASLRADGGAGPNCSPTILPFGFAPPPFEHLRAPLVPSSAKNERLGGQRAFAVGLPPFRMSPFICSRAPIHSSHRSPPLVRSLHASWRRRRTPSRAAPPSTHLTGAPSQAVCSSSDALIPSYAQLTRFG